MSTAPYEVNISGTDDETFQFAIPFELADGSDFPFAAYTIDYSLMQEGCQVLRLTQSSGIEVAAPVVTFTNPAGSVQKGDYRHGCRITESATGIVTQVFDGSVTIGEGNF